MKNKIVKFYREHEVGIGIATFIAGTAAAVIGTYLLIENGKTIDGMKITGGGMLEGSDDNVFVVLLKNGSERTFIRPEA